MRMWLIFSLAFWVPALAKADALSLEAFAVFQGAGDVDGLADTRAQLVQCLQDTRTPRVCIGATVPTCRGESEACETLETKAWEHYGYDVYLALRRALGGPDWIDTAHARIGAEMAARCAGQLSDDGKAAVQVCQLREAAARALDLRFALVAP